MLPAIAVFLGAGFGGLMRHFANLAGARLFGMTGFPLTTMLVNIAGCFIMGVFTAWFAFKAGAGTMLPQHVRLFLTTGILGGFTTFSTFSLEFAVLVERGEMGQAAAYAAGSLVLCLVAVFAGLGLVRALG
ncbi:putative fluoride ion transporter CrcB [Azorhizobium oxalatiphilum]|uniref:Fluoride-specific ion channel FluC n=1 Tax=Azorhizobium oxalatiphilum TaxID=980631 RepID=A0A917BYA1_9HYPH|nr:fluoride efflux transporter CrcB [Azorhizobium oxalatiphilum]GGF63404.1 putative fluoride ion transporter CrcB [Azorhizobium oxalatiphilum]